MLSVGAEGQATSPRSVWSLPDTGGQAPAQGETSACMTSPHIHFAWRSLTLQPKLAKSPDPRPFLSRPPPTVWVGSTSKV